VGYRLALAGGWVSYSFYGGGIDLLGDFIPC
jgi:hypothetical protein